MCGFGFPFEMPVQFDLPVIPSCIFLHIVYTIFLYAAVLMVNKDDYKNAVLNRLPLAERQTYITAKNSIITNDYSSTGTGAV